MVRIVIVLTILAAVQAVAQARLRLEPCGGAKALKDAKGTDLFCGRGSRRTSCPRGSYCDIHPTDRWAKCCPSDPSCKHRKPWSRFVEGNCTQRCTCDSTGRKRCTPLCPQMLIRCKPFYVPKSFKVRVRGTKCFCSRVRCVPVTPRPCHGDMPLVYPRTRRPYSCFRSRCPRGSYCHAHPADAYAVCCRERKPCGGATPLKDAKGTDLFCGRGPGRTSCPRGSYCDIHPTDLWAKCCPRASRTKPGKCPRYRPRRCRYRGLNQCKYDSDCKGKHKCCTVGRCGRMCVKPVPPSPKPGKCPRLRGSRKCTGLRQHQCNYDSDCQDKQKCCAVDRCGRKCVNPALSKPGKCPRKTPKRCRGGRRYHCKYDSDCKGKTKCCGDRCGRQCVTPVKDDFVKPGRCPNTSGIITPCVLTPDNCFSDSMCLGNKKCCPYGCGKRCLNPVRVKGK